MKRVLIISYYWPPSGGVGVLRCLKFVKYLHNFGWEPVVYSPFNANYLLRDNTNFKDIPEDLELLKGPIVEPFSAYKFLSGRKKDDPTDPVHVRNKKHFIDNFAIWVRGNFFIPDARCLWIRPSVRYLKKYLKEHPVDAIFTDGPPHTNTLIGMKLSSELGIPWLADFQDPWTQADYYQRYKIMYWANKRHHRLEQKAFQTAGKITIASPSWAKNLEQIGARNVGVIYYGYDEDDFKKRVPVPDPDFTIVHTGQLGFDRNPDVLFHVLKELKNELAGFAAHLKLVFAGNIDFSVKKEIVENGLGENFCDQGFVTRDRALQLNMNARLLLLPLNKSGNADGRIPGKLFENLRTGRPILCLGPSDSDVARIIETCRAGISFSYNDRDRIKKFLTTQYEQFLAGEHYSQPCNIAHFSNEEQTRVLSQYLNQLVDSHA
ncbi:MAG: glycosyltransferase family 4 protein [Bacteroidales bacterium]|nr:glycosyltransferase family 4 protein [Bacteroidales bacterium]